ncbi:MAG: phosphoglucosamine mutase [Gammaproteobacteria bacterium]|nr:MAG: phosphoglucosamine mutase [Gammaproteobacteria bacterium]
MAVKHRFFGTDGIRGRVGSDIINPEFVLRLGWAAGRVLSQQGKRRVVIGKDTRISGYMFESALQAGLSAAGVDVYLLGPMPTPGIAYLTRTLHADAGIVISASHNPYHDNGIKFFSAEGEKLPEETELSIEAMLTRPVQTADSRDLGKARRINDAAGRYIEFCKRAIPIQATLRGMRLVVDCANGATYHIAPNVFLELGAEVIVIGDQPDGLNINEGCGSLYPEKLREAVLHHRADAGIALDGDGDRVIMVAHDGKILDGDDLLYIIAGVRLQDKHAPEEVVGTLMTNIGLEQALNDMGIRLIRTKVGDKYVLEEMKRRDSRLGGETSGHILCLDKTTTGDGIIAALEVLFAVLQSGKTLSELTAGWQKYPQVMINVRVSRSISLETSEPIQAEIQKIENVLGKKGRLVLRPSGTEPVIRVMVEAEDQEMARTCAESLAKVIEGETV